MRRWRFDVGFNADKSRAVTTTNTAKEISDKLRQIEELSGEGEQVVGLAGGSAGYVQICAEEICQN